MNTSMSTGQPTIPIKQVINKKFIPLVVGCSSGDKHIPAKLFDDQKVQQFIQEVLNQFEEIKEKNSSLYAIRLKSTNQYINEKNRAELLALNDQIRFHEVELCFNLETEVKTYIEKISSLKLNNAEQLINQLSSIEKFIASDRIFAFEFFAKGGKKMLIDYIKECDRTSDNKKWNLLYHLYKILVLLIKNWSLISWDHSEIDLPVIKLICDTINDSSKENKKLMIPDPLVLLFLQIIDDILNKSQHTRELMLKEIKFIDIIFIIQRPNMQIKEALLTFLNSCYNKGDENFKKNLNTILTQPLMAAALREQIRYLYNLNTDSASISNNDSDSLDYDVENGSVADIDTIGSNSADSHKFMGLSIPWPRSLSFQRVPESITSTAVSSLSDINNSEVSVNSARKKYLPNFNKLKMRMGRNNMPKEAESTNNPSIFYEQLDLNASKDEKNIESVFRNIAILQKNILDLDLGHRMKLPADQSYSTKLKNICYSAFETMNNEKHMNDDEKYNKLGFTNTSNPLDDFSKPPPGSLALDFMEYFATKPTLRAIFQSFVNEKLPKNSDYAFPFAKGSIHLIKYLCSMLSIGENVNENDKNAKNNKNEFSSNSTIIIKKQYEILFIMFAINNDGIYEFFAKCLWLFHRLWLEMKAQSLDFDRALSAFKDSIYKILSDTNKLEQTDLPASALVKKKLNDFNLLIETWKYDFIKNIKSRFDKTLNPIKDVERILTEEVIAMIRPKRLHVLCRGEKFDKIERRSKQKQIWKLSSDYKTFHFADMDNIDKNEYLDVDRIKDVRKDVKKDDLKRQSFQLVLTIKKPDEQGEQNILLASQNEDIVEAWHDGINLLINPKPSTNVTCLVECLTDTQLLDLHTLNLEIPHDIPKVPELPKDFEFKLIAT